MSAGESREKQALRLLNEATAEALGPGRRRLGNVRVVASEDADGRIEVEQEQMREQVTRIPTGKP